MIYRNHPAGIIRHIMAVTSAVLLGLAGTAAWAQSTHYDSNYAMDRSMIEDLEARYMYALNWLDPEGYASTFTEDGVLDWAGGVASGRAEIAEEIRTMAAGFAAEEAQDAPLRPARKRHFITNIAVTVEGDTAVSHAYWFIMNNRNADRKGYSEAYGHYESQLRKVDGRWLFVKRTIFNEEYAHRTAPLENPAPY
ncbi:MAG: nuclear transport factor 2 family protein [Pseudohongiellaceae bacterium]